VSGNTQTCSCPLGFSGLLCEIGPSSTGKGRKFRLADSFNEIFFVTNSLPLNLKATATTGTTAMASTLSP
jgi:hypothetical protein